jgi:tetratricopeptide (TPR) repeat protein
MLRRLLCCGVTLLLTAASVAAAGQQPLDTEALALAEALAIYRGGDLRAALERLSTIPDAKVHDTVERFSTRGDVAAAVRRVRMRISAALVTEMAFVRIQHGSGGWQDPYMLSARTIVRRLAQMAESGHDGAGDAERQYARDWYLLVASFRHGRAEVGWSRPYLAEARDLFPNDARVLLVSGSDHEMLSHMSAGFLRRFNTNGQAVGEWEVNPGRELEQAERFLRQAVARGPELAEAHLRFGRVLYRRGDLAAAARELQAVLASTTVDPIRYLAWTFMGQVEVERGNLEAAERCYTEAERLLPAGQVARVARSELAYSSGRGADAAAQMTATLQQAGKDDPWWLYLLGDWWHFEARLALMRAEAMR